MENDQTTSTTRTRTCSCSCCDCLWIVTTKEGWLKLIEAIMTFLTFVICVSFPNSTDKLRFEFLIFVATSLFILLVLYIILGTTHLLEKLPPALRHPILGVVFCSLAFLTLVVGSGIVFAKGSDFHIRTLKAAGICGFISSALFLFEGVYYFILYRHKNIEAHTGNNVSNLYSSFFPYINVWDQKVQTFVFYEAFLLIT